MEIFHSLLQKMRQAIDEIDTKDLVSANYCKCLIRFILHLLFHQGRQRTEYESYRDMLVNVIGKLEKSTLKLDGHISV